MSSSNGSARGSWVEVNTSRPCPQCNHGNWCQVTADGVMSMCMREGAAGAEKRTGSDGTDYWLLRLIPRADRWAPPKYHHADGNGEVADADTLDRVYGELLRRLPITPAINALEPRGMSRNGIAARGYRWLPSKGRAKAVHALVDAGLEVHFPRTPGLFVRHPDEANRDPYWTLGGRPGLLIPIRDVQGRIIRLLVRPEDPGDGGKYQWISSKNRGGAGSGAPVHVPLFSADADRTIVRVTEGALKADIATVLSGTLTLGMAGVKARIKAGKVLRDLGAKRVRVALDDDARTNRNVASGLSQLVGHLRHQGFDVELETWQGTGCKGIDDLLAAGGTPTVLTGEAVAVAVQGIVCEADTADPPSTASRSTDGHDDIHLTDCGNAIRVVRDHGQDLRHCHPWRKWLAWDGSRWRLDDTAATTLWCKQTVCRMFHDAVERVHEIQAQLKGADGADA
jgi:hypothetical protein